MDTIKSSLTHILTIRNESMRAGNESSILKSDFNRNKPLWALNTNKHLADCRAWYRSMGDAYAQQRTTKEMQDVLAKVRAMEVCIQKYSDQSAVANDH